MKQKTQQMDQKVCLMLNLKKKKDKNVHIEEFETDCSVLV